jgi:hypothetical protein
MKTDVPNPGSKEAVEGGCKCAIIDNHYGKGFPWPGYKENVFYISGDCPIHGFETKYGEKLC